MHLKFPISICKFFLVILNVGLHDVVPCELDVSSVGEEGWHPGHVPTGGIQKSLGHWKFLKLIGK